MSPRHWILSTGVSRYGAQAGLPDLPAAVHDAALLLETFESEYNARGHLLASPRDLAAGPGREFSGRSLGEGTSHDLLDRLDALRRLVGPEDWLVVHYAGHADTRGEFRLLPYGARPGQSSSTVSLRELLASLAALPVKHFLLLLDTGVPTEIALRVPEGTGDRHWILVASGQTPPAEDTRRRSTPLCSPFSAALRHHLCTAVPPGQSLDLPRLLESLRAGGCPRALLLTAGAAADDRSAACGLRRPRLRVRVTLPGPPCAGDPLAALVTATDPAGRPVPVQPRFFHIETLPAGERLRRAWRPETDVFPRAGEYTIECAWTDPETTEESAQLLVVSVGEALERPLTISPARLPPCLKGREYVARIPVTGGHPPYEGLVLSGSGADLVTGTIEPSPVPGGPSVILLRGHVPAPPGAGTAAAEDGDPTTRTLGIAVRDARGNCAEAVFRLLVFSPDDYVHIPGGPFEVGYSPNHRQDAAIRDMLVRLGRWLLSQNRKLSAEEQRIAAAVSRNQADLIVKEIVRDNPGARVELPEFYIRRYPVTNRAWRAYVQAQASASPPPHVPPHWSEPPPRYFPEAWASLPVVGVAYEHLCAFLRWKGTRLPTAWEWERAARGTDGRLFPWGDTYDPRRCNLKDSGPGHLTPVDAHPDAASPEGVCDLVGNAAEWVERRVFGQGAFFQIFRGGSFRDGCGYALAMRDSAEAGVRYGEDEFSPEVGVTAFDWLGFREVVDLDPDPAEAQALVEIPEIVLKGQDNRETRVPRFAMSRYAVSNEEYWEFVREAGHAYPPEWSPKQDPPFPALQRHLPVVQVTYRDALAFCLWKSRRERRIIRLPTAGQWLAAVDGGAGHPYPWGATFNLQHCNSRHSGWGRRLPVFALRTGCSAQGLYNLVGNVCEWITPWEVRGGSWQDDGARAAGGGFRFGIPQTPGARFHRNDIGFRYVSLR